MPLPQMIGTVAVEAKILGALLTQPTVFMQVREDNDTEICFAPDGMQPLAEKVLEYLDNAMELAACSLADFLSFLGDSPLLVQAIQVQQQADGLEQHERAVKDGLRLLAGIRGQGGSVTGDNPADLLRLAQDRKAREAQGADPLTKNPYFRR